MKRMLESMLGGPGWFWNHKIRIAVLIMIFTVTTPHHVWSQFLNRCCESITVGLSSASNAFTSAIGWGLKCIFAVDHDIEKCQRTVIWPMFEREAQCTSGSDDDFAKFNRTVVWPRYKENHR